MTARLFAIHPRRCALVGVIVLGLCLALRVGGAQGAAFEPHRVIVGYRPGALSTVAAHAEIRMGMRVAAPSPAPGARVLRLPAHESVMAAVVRLRAEPGVAYADPDYVAHAAGDFYPNDPGRADRRQGWEQMQWNMLPESGIDAPEAWANLIADHRAGGRGVVIAVLDTGVAYRNWHQFHESPDFTGTRFVSPYDFVDDTRFPLDRNGHGTFVAGTLAEATNNGFGLTGLAYGASIMPVRVLDAQGDGDEATIARGIRYAVEHGAQVINLSLEFPPNQVNSGSEIPEILAAIDYAHRRGVTVVGAAGNDEAHQVAYPARLPDVISVGATTRDRCIADYSNTGSTLNLVAPGGGEDAILSGDPDCRPQRQLPPIYQLTLSAPPHWDRFGYPGYYIGTSMAAPEVAGTAALVIASRVIGRHPSPAQILARLEQTATPLPEPGVASPGSAPVPRPDVAYGYGLVDAGAATASVVRAAATGGGEGLRPAG